MALDEKLLEKARTSPQNLTYDEAKKLAGQLGFEPVGGRGSHTVYHHPEGQKVRSEFRPLNLQEGKNGKAKRYQVEQMLQMAEGTRSGRAARRLIDGNTEILLSRFLVICGYGIYSDVR